MDDSAPTLMQEAPTLAQPSTERRSGSSPPSVSSYDSLDEARFVPGTMLAGRYRIVGLLGKGGMGEVYRAEDLKLGQPVALKFLPEALAQDGAMLARFHSEVRIARQVSHPNVCRVFDIGEAEGQPFLSMEYIDGEDLASLLRRIGRLPEDKAIEIARQLCAGLAAAHDNGVLHRDLKPSNIMIDGRGKVRVTDFGLAGMAEHFRGHEVRAGTPAYMAPEQLGGKEVTIKSDIYALGLILYEVFTGKRAFDSSDIVELVRLHTQTTPASPSTLVKDLDPLVERVILRCLEKDPQKRPTSAIQIAAALPGGDPLAAALAAGETPSPEMVAAARKEGGLRPALAVTCLAAVVIGLVVVVLLSGRVMLHNKVPLEKSPEVLAEWARVVINKLGYTPPPVDSAFGFSTDAAHLQYIKEHEPSTARWDQLTVGRPSPLYFWYRQSPRYMSPYNRQFLSAVDPPRLISGMTGVSLDPQGRLLSFYAVPPQIDEPQAVTAQPAWSVLFSEAGLDQTTFKPVDSKWVPPQPYDVRAAWEGVYPAQPQVPIRIEAAAYRGRPVFFSIIHPWDRPLRQESSEPTTNDKIVWAIVVILLAVVLLGAVLLARRNARLGRGDQRGAFRLAFFMFAMTMLSLLLLTHHVPVYSAEFSLLMENAAISTLLGCFLWLVYLALEPYVRRRWPERIISWTRLLAGDFRDPLVGRDLLIGALFGTVFLLTTYLQHIAPTWVGHPADVPMGMMLNSLRGVDGLLGMFANQVINALLPPSVFLFMLLLLSILLRKEWAAIGAIWIVLTLFEGLTGNTVMAWLFGGLMWALYLVLLTRFGLLAMVVAHFYVELTFYYPLTSNFSAWYAGGAFFALGVSVAVAGYGFYRSLAGQPLFQGGIWQE
jgi:serine/threonine-protein kinase